MSDKTKSVTSIGFVSDQTMSADIGGLVSDKTKSLTGIGFMGDKTMSADFLRFSER